MYCSLNNVDKYGNIKKSRNASDLNLTDAVGCFGTLRYCGSNNVITNNQYMSHIWNRQNQKNVQFKFKNCFSNVGQNEQDYYYFVTEDGKLYVGGNGRHYILGVASNSNKTQFTQIATDRVWKKVIGRYSVNKDCPTSYFLTQDGNLYFSGRQSYAYYWNGSDIALGDVAQQLKEDDVKVEDVQPLYAGCIILDKDGYIWSKGYNRQGQLGNGLSGSANNNQSRNYFEKVSLAGKQPTNDWVKIAAGFDFCYALNKKGQLYSWGSNGFGQLGLGITQTLKSTPQLVTNGRLLFDDVSCGSYHMICKDIQGNIYTVGRNNYGQLGDGTTTDKNQLVKIFSNLNARKVVGGQYSTAIIDSIGGCYCVGYSNNTIITGYNGNVLQWTKIGHRNGVEHISMCCNSFCLIGD